MYLNLPLGLIFYLLAPSEANLLSRTSESIGAAAHQVHGVALKHSAGLARDLRLALNGVLVSHSIPSGHRLYCTSSRPDDDGSDNGGTNNGNRANSSSLGTSSSTGSSGAGSTTKTATSSAPLFTPSTYTSPWKLVESHQGSNFFSGWDFFTGGDPTGGESCQPVI